MWLVCLAAAGWAAFALWAGSAAAAGGGLLNVFSTGPGFAGAFPTGFVPGTDGDVWFSLVPAPGDSVVGKIAPDGTITDYSGDFEPGAIVSRALVGPDGNVWFIEYGASPAIGEISATGTVAQYPIDTAPESPVLGTNGSIWFSEPHALGEITATGQITVFSTGLLREPGDLVSGPDGNIWFTESEPAAIGRITPDGTITSYDLPSGSAPEQITAGLGGDIWFTDVGSAPAIGRITTDGTITEYPAPVGESSSIAAGPGGDVWFGAGVGSIGRVAADGTVTVYSIGVPGTVGEIVPGADGNMWFLIDSSAAIGEITPSGTITVHDLSGVGFEPNTITTAADGMLWSYGLVDSDVPAIAQYDLGAPSASVNPPAISGSGKQGDPQQCAGATWASWAGEQPLPDAYGFDGYQWLLDGAPIAGAIGQDYTPTSADVGHALACKVTATYPFLATTVSATSTPATVQAAGQRRRWRRRWRRRRRCPEPACGREHVPGPTERR